MNCAVLFLAQSKQVGELRTFCVFAVHKEHSNIVLFFFFCNFRKPRITDKQCIDQWERRFIKLIFLLMCHLS